MGRRGPSWTESWKIWPLFQFQAGQKWEKTSRNLQEETNPQSTVLCITIPAPFGHALHRREHQSIIAQRPFPPTCLYNNNVYLLKKLLRKKKHIGENELCEEGRYVESSVLRNKPLQKEYPLEIGGALRASRHTI